MLATNGMPLLSLMMTLDPPETLTSVAVIALMGNWGFPVAPITSTCRFAPETDSKSSTVEFGLTLMTRADPLIWALDSTVRSSSPSARSTGRRAAGRAPGPTGRTRTRRETGFSRSDSWHSPARVVVRAGGIARPDPAERGTRCGVTGFVRTDAMHG